MPGKPMPTCWVRPATGWSSRRGEQADEGYAARQRAGLFPAEPRGHALPAAAGPRGGANRFDLAGDVTYPPRRRDDAGRITGGEILRRAGRRADDPYRRWRGDARQMGF